MVNHTSCAVLYVTGASGDRLCVGESMAIDSASLEIIFASRVSGRHYADCTEQVLYPVQSLWLSSSGHGLSDHIKSTLSGTQWRGARVLVDQLV